MTTKRMIVIWMLLAGPVTGRMIAQSDYMWRRTGDALYGQGVFSEAELAYRKALEKEKSPESVFNLGNAVYRQDRLDEAVTSYEEAIRQTDVPNLKSDAWYNLGNAHFRQEKFPESITAYREALKLNPENESARQNLQLALRALKRQQEEEQKKQQDQQQQPDDAPQADGPENPPPETPDPSEEQTPESGETAPQEAESEAQSAPDDRPISEEEARQILKAIEREDQLVQEKLKKKPGKTTPAKDW